MMEPARPKSSRLTLLGLFALFAAPLAAAFWLYYGSAWRPTGTTNHGVLIQPLRELPALDFPHPAARAAVARLFTGKWSLVVVANGHCDETCRNSLVYARQTHIGLGRLSVRVQRVLLVPADCCDRAYLDREHAGLQIADLGGGDAALGAGARRVARRLRRRTAGATDLHRRSAGQPDDELRHAAAIPRDCATT